MSEREVPYTRPAYGKIFCPRCDEKSIGYRGEHALRRHIERAHISFGGLPGSAGGYIPPELFPRSTRPEDFTHHQPAVLNEHGMDDPMEDEHDTRTDFTGQYPTTIPRSGYIRPARETIKCPRCNEKPDGFGGEHELRRHIERAHNSMRRYWACSEGKRYGVYYNAAAHLRRAHFGPQRKRERVWRKSGAGNTPPMDEPKSLRLWMKEVEEDAGERGEIVEEEDERLIMEDIWEQTLPSAPSEVCFNACPERDMYNSTGRYQIDKGDEAKDFFADHTPRGLLLQRGYDIRFEPPQGLEIHHAQSDPPFTTSPEDDDDDDDDRHRYRSLDRTQPPPPFRSSEGATGPTEANNNVSTPSEAARTDFHLHLQSALEILTAIAHSNRPPSHKSLAYQSAVWEQHIKACHALPPSKIPTSNSALEDCDMQSMLLMQFNWKKLARAPVALEEVVRRLMDDIGKIETWLESSSSLSDVQDMWMGNLRGVRERLEVEEAG